MKKTHNGFIKLLSFIIASFMLFSSFGTSLCAESEENNVWIKVFYGGTERAFRSKPFVSDSELYLPLREIMNLCGVSNDDISYDNGKINVLFKSNPDIWVTAEMNVNQNGVSFDKDSEYEIIGIYDSIRSTTHPIVLVDDTAYIPLGMLIRIKNYYVSQDYEKRVYLNLLGDLEVWQYALCGKFFPGGRYDVVLSAPIDVNQTDKYDAKSYYGDDEDVFIGTVSDFEMRKFTHTEINGYYFPTEAHKCILIDDDNKVIAVMPYENFRHESVNPTLCGVSTWENTKYYLDDVRADTETELNTIPYGRGGLSVCQGIPKISPDGKPYQYSLPYCFVDFRYVVKN